MLVEDSVQRRYRRSFSDHYLNFGLPLVLLAVLVGFGVTTPGFATLENVEGMIRTASVTGFLFLGLTWVFAVGEIDVSFVGIAAITNMVIAGLVSDGYGWEIASLIGLLVGLLFGIVNGVLIAYLGLASLITTIAVGGVGIALAGAINQGSSLPIPQAETLGFLITAHFGPIPFLALLCAAVFLVAWFIQERLTFGHYIYAIAENREAVIEAGIPVSRIITLIFVFSALCGSFGGFLLTVELSSCQPSIAASFFLDGLTAVLLGGTMLKLGKPNVLGTLVSVVLLAALVRGGALLGWPDSFFQIMKGALLLVGVALVVWTRKEGE